MGYLFTRQNTRAISDGSHKSQFTSSIPRNEVKGLAPSDPCVFAKSCVSVPAGSIDAGTSIEPAKNFGSVSVLGTTSALTAVGDAVLGRVSGAAIEGAAANLGGWALKGLSGAGTLLLAFWPRDIGDSTLYTADQLAAMSAASTRVRFQFRADQTGNVQVYGLHTSILSGMSSVPTIEAKWNGDKSAMTAALGGGITITWTPNNGPVVQAPTAFPGVTDQLENILVHPIQEGTDSQIEVYPAADDLTWQDGILVFPADSGVPPLYLVFAKPSVKLLEVGLYSDFTGRLRNGLEVDHMPSRAAVKRYIQNHFPEASPKQIESMLGDVASIAIPAHVHRKHSQTYGWKNSKDRQIRDAQDLRNAVDSNFDAVEAQLLAEGVSKSELKAAREQMHKANESQGWY